jgi:hypothetical protein
LKAEIECPLCKKRLKISLKRNGKVSKKDYKARMKQHITLSKIHENLRLPPGGSSEKVKRVLRNLDL